MKDRKNILLMTSPAPKFSPFSTKEKKPPLGLGFLMAVLKKDGHVIHFSDEYLRRSNSIESDYLQKNNIDYVGIYSNTVCFSETVKLLDKIQKLRIEKKWKGKLIVGGPHPSLMPHDFPDYVDHIVIGEGEKKIINIVEEQEKDRILYGERIEDLDSLPRPAWEEFIKLPYNWTDNFVNSHSVFTLNTSRGCPFGCKFCSVKGIWGKTYRTMSPARVFEDMIFLKKNYNAKCIYFREDNFTLNKKRIIELCNLLIKNNQKIDWLCETRADSLQDFEYVDLMARSGCKVFYIGVESGSQRMLDFVKKGETIQQFINAFDNARRAGIKTYASFIFGLPTETNEDIKLTKQLIKRIKPDFVGKNVFVGLPGSELYQYAKDHKMYEYEDEKGLLFLKGHNSRVNKYYRCNPYFKMPPTVSKYECILYDLCIEPIRKILRCCINIGVLPTFR
ncbi:MAG: radical SAM protein [bacterium]